MGAFSLACLAMTMTTTATGGGEFVTAIVLANMHVLLPGIDERRRATNNCALTLKLSHSSLHCSAVAPFRTNRSQKHTLYLTYIVGVCFVGFGLVLQPASSSSSPLCSSLLQPPKLHRHECTDVAQIAARMSVQYYNVVCVVWRRRQRQRQRRRRCVYGKNVSHKNMIYIWNIYNVYDVHTCAVRCVCGGVRATDYFATSNVIKLCARSEQHNGYSARLLY